jgi:hypothetical protein
MSSSGAAHRTIGVPVVEVLSVTLAGTGVGARHRAGILGRRAADRLPFQSRRHERRRARVLRPALTAFGFEIEAGKTASGKIRRPVLFGENGRPIVAYEVDGFHPGLGIVLEVEAGRGAAGNADYRDLVRTSLIVDAEYLVLGMMLEYKTGKTTMRSYERTRDQLDAIYASERLRLPFKGVLVVGY